MSCKTLQIADAMVEVLAGHSWPEGLEAVPVWRPLPVFDLANLEGLQVCVLTGHDAATFTADPGLTMGKLPAAIVLQQKLAATNLEDDVAALLELEEALMGLFLGKRLAGFAGEAICRTAELAGYDLPALKESLEFLGIVTLTFDLQDE